MNDIVPRRGLAGRLGEIGLWGSAGLLVLTVHIAAAALLMQQAPEVPAENGPQAAIMIELAAEPVAAKTEEEQIAPDQTDVEEVKSEQVEPVEEPQPDPVEQPQPAPEPTPEPVVEQPPPPVEPPPPEVVETPPDPTPPPEVAEQPPEETPPPEPEIAQTLPEPTPEPPPEPIDPIEEKVTAALDNVEVPLPMVRPPPPAPTQDEPKKTEPRKQPVQKVQKPKQQQQAVKEKAEARVQTEQSDRTAALQTSTGSIFSSMSPTTWKSRVQSRLARNARRCPGNGVGTAAVRFSFDGSGNVTNVSLSRSSGDGQIDDYIVSVVRRASPIPAPPSGVPNFLVQALTCSR